ncbi:hypothetical protein [Neobacillus vireti]|uniref:hypothetical protein n=1 Tax=Neobacillus vireti TaxID=220686 RepID=UPI002FFF78E4
MKACWFLYDFFLKAEVATSAIFQFIICLLNIKKQGRVRSRVNFGQGRAKKSKYLSEAEETLGGHGDGSDGFF